MEPTTFPMVAIGVVWLLSLQHEEFPRPRHLRSRSEFLAGLLSNPVQVNEAV